MTTGDVETIELRDQPAGDPASMTRRAAIRRLGSGSLAVAAGAALLAGAESGGAAAQASEVLTAEEVARQVVDAVNQGDLDALDALVAPDFVGNVPIPLPGKGKGVDGVKENLVALRTGFPDAELTILDLVDAGEKVVVRGVLRGTHTGEFLGVPPTGEAIELSGICFARVVDGKAVEYWSQFDTLGALEQTGLFSLETLGADDGSTGEGTATATPGY